MDVIMSFRNIWRNPRRTIVILLAVLVGVWNMLVLASLMRGIEREMVKNGISNMTGSIQIHQKDYTDDPVVENSIHDRARLEKALDAHIQEPAAWAQRIRVNVVAANARHSGGVNMVGVDPEHEARVSFVAKSIVQGRYLEKDDSNAIVVGRAFLKSYDTRIGNKLILMGQDTNQDIASKAFRIVGVFMADMESVEKHLVFVTKSQAASMLKLGDAISETVILIPETDMSGQRESALAQALSTDLGPDYSVETWRDLLPMMRAYLDTNDFFLYIWYGVVFVAMGFGVVNTTLMAVYERMREFGLMKALGLTPLRMVRGVLMESFFILITGIALGGLMGLVTVLLLARTGIDLSSLAAGTDMWGMPRIIYPVLAMNDMLIAGGVVLVLGLLVSLYPAIKAARFTPVEAMMIR
ncbi:MAG: ABC transporter permease [Proteobacteria bacterium]|nr:ABC transporter permease [Pseudomonadota bacterium]